MSVGWEELPEELAEALYAYMTNPLTTAEAELGVAVVKWVEENVDNCAAMLYAGTYYNPPEYCDELAEPGREYCPRHPGYEED